MTRRRCEGEVKLIQKLLNEIFNLQANFRRILLWFTLFVSDWSEVFTLLVLYSQQSWRVSADDQSLRSAYRWDCRRFLSTEEISPSSRPMRLRWELKCFQQWVRKVSMKEDSSNFVRNQKCQEITIPTVFQFHLKHRTNQSMNLFKHEEYKKIR